ncbi:MAG: Zn-ribbon domain-containing OB-fold protein [Anaerolineales bacterium]|nr:Zn-ribbon domain-containing OB-fold protein [Chloroflexota bacterium]MBL7161987.1 Zn-ribbon domain-containing OB-fold protein [Anaerolineales bacterium]
MTEHNFTHVSFEHFLGEQKLMGARCKACDTLYLPPRPMCTECYRDDMNWAELPENGKLIAFTTIHIAPTAMLEAGYGRDNPYVSGIVELENGLAISAQIMGLDAAKPEEIKIGTALKAEYVERGEGEANKTFLAFRAL